MNIKEELEKDFLRLQKILRELRFLRYNHMNNKDRRAKIEQAIQLLGPMSDEFKSRLDEMTKSIGDYDL